MKAPSRYEFDAKGFFFFLKVIPLLLFVGFFFQFGIQAFSGALNEGGGFLAMADASTRQHLGGVAGENGIQNTKMSEERFLNTRVIEGHTIKSVVPDEGKFVGIDLENMKALLYEDGEVTQTLPLLSKGSPGSHWETPSGVYEIKLKERKHFSSIGHVYMPYSMQFYGNYFIHGWPYYPGGKPVPKGYSGGCVRLSTENAKKIYDFVDVGTGVYVYEGEVDHAQKPFVVLSSSDAPETTAWSYLVADIETGEIYASKQANVKHPIASVTKFMTAVVANETIRFDSPIDVADSGVHVAPSEVAPDEHFVIGELLYPLILESNNQTAEAIAKYYWAGEDAFTQLMNEKAKALGMKNTHFDDASGLSVNNYSTANDLYHLAKYVYDVKSFILHMSRQEARSVISSNDTKYIFHNKTHFLDREDYLGGKIGYIPASRETMIAYFRVSMDGQEHVVAFIVLGAVERKDAVLALLNWLENAT